MGKEVHITSDLMVAISWVNGSGFGSLKHVRDQITFALLGKDIGCF